MSPLSRLSFLVIAWKRLWTQRTLAVSIAVGMVVAVALGTSIPLYADAVNARRLRRELARDGRPPFALLFRYVGAWHGAVSWERYALLDDYLTAQGPATIGLPLRQTVRHVKTDNLQLFPATAAYADARRALGWVSLGFVTGFEDHVVIGEAAPPATDALPVLVSRTLAEKVGLQAGERYRLFGDPTLSPTGERPVVLEVQIVGVWEPRTPTDPFWFYPPRAFEEVLLVPEATFRQQVVPALRAPVYQAVWYQTFDGSRVQIADLDGLISHIAAVEARAAGLLPGTRLDLSPVEAMERYRQATRRLMVQLTTFALPALGIVLYFIGLLAAMVVRHQRNEIAILRSRGASRSQVIVLTLSAWLLIGLPALIGGLLVGRELARQMGRVRSFLTLAPRAPLSVAITPTGLAFGLLVAGVALLTALLPVLGAARHTIVTYKREVARTLRRPLWQRAYLDLLLLIPSLYGYLLLRRQGRLLPSGPGPTGDPFQNPLLFLVPSLMLLALALLVVRLFPLLMEGLARLSGWLSGTVPVLILRHLARSPAHYTGPLLLLLLTLGLAFFTASMARTLDDHLIAQVYYRVGADLRLMETGESPRQALGVGRGPAGMGGGAASPSQEEPVWLFLPVEEHLRVPGVLAATRVGNYQATARLGDALEQGRFLGVDRADFPRVAFFRRDFAPASLGALMNALALERRGLLVNRAFLERHSLQIGDPLPLVVNVLGETREVPFVIVGAVDYFPTLYPEDGPFFVGNLDYLFEQMGGLYPYDVWLSVAEGTPTETILAGLQELGLAVVGVEDARALIAEAMARPERQGAFGLLSAGFLMAALLTVLGFWLHALLAFRRRFIELGVLRAIGLSVEQMAAFLAGEQALLIAVGTAAGTGLGVGLGRLFIPFLQVEGGPYPYTPPFVVEIAWESLQQLYLILGGMLLVATLLTVHRLARMRLFEAVKLGETM